MQNPPEKHHYIPEFYSKLWTRTDGRLVRFDRPFNQIVHKNVFPSQVGFQRNLYRIPGTSPQKSQHLEMSFFKFVDNDAAQSLRIILNTNSNRLDSSIRIGWTRFLLSLMHRTPSSFTALREGLKILVAMPDNESQAKYEKMRRNGDPELLEDFLRSRSPYALEHAAYSIMPRLMDHNRLGIHIANMEWGTLNLKNARHSLLLSDAPLITSNGIGNADGHILLPLGPDVLFYAVINDDVRERIIQIPDTEIVKRINRMIVSRARHFVASNKLDQLSFISKHFGSESFETWAESLHNHYKSKFDG